MVKEEKKKEKASKLSMNIKVFSPFVGHKLQWHCLCHKLDALIPTF